MNEDLPKRPANGPQGLCAVRLCCCEWLTRPANLEEGGRGPSPSLRRFRQKVLLWRRRNGENLPRCG
jgi:hypothetical protein